MRHALIHKARYVTRTKGPRNDQGERSLSPPEESQWIKCRLMERGAVASKRRRNPEQSTDAQVKRGYELLLDFETIPTVDAPAAAVEEPKAGMIVETECPILGSPTIELGGEPEHLNDGRKLIGYLCYAEKPKDRL